MLQHRQKSAIDFRSGFEVGSGRELIMQFNVNPRIVLVLHPFLIKTFNTSRSSCLVHLKSNDQKVVNINVWFTERLLT